ncbi:MAG: ribonuclease VapC [Euryarchaeota archaeon]|nr:ribonuclease VapC [Euryarchaeota archaeon]
MTKVLVLDTSALFGGFDVQLAEEPLYTVYEVLQEVKDEERKLKAELSIETKKLTILEPLKQSIQEIEKLAIETGDIGILSTADIKILALALDLREKGFNPKIVTDDYSIQNLAAKLGIEYQKIITVGIKEIFIWIKYCPACHKVYPMQAQIENCEVCGTKLKKKVGEKRALEE